MKTILQCLDIACVYACVLYFVVGVCALFCVCVFICMPRYMCTARYVCMITYVLLGMHMCTFLCVGLCMCFPAMYTASVYRRTCACGCIVCAVPMAGSI